MKKALLILAGVLPLAAGWLLDALAAHGANTPLLYACALPAFLALWLAMGFLLRPLAGSLGELALFWHLPAAVDVLLLLALILNLRYLPIWDWLPTVGTLALRFYGPLLWLAGRLVEQRVIAFLLCFAALLGAGTLGGFLRDLFEKRGRP